MLNNKSLNQISIIRIIFLVNHPSYCASVNKINAATKHIAVAYNIQRDYIAKGNVALSYIASSDMTADGMTKALPREKVKRCRMLFGLRHLGTHNGLIWEGVSNHALITATMIEASQTLRGTVVSMVSFIDWMCVVQIYANRLRIAPSKVRKVCSLQHRTNYLREQLTENNVDECGCCVRAAESGTMCVNSSAQGCRCAVCRCVCSWQ